MTIEGSTENESRYRNLIECRKKFSEAVIIQESGGAFDNASARLARIDIKIAQLNDSSRSPYILFSIFRISNGLRTDINKL